MSFESIGKDIAEGITRLAEIKNQKPQDYEKNGILYCGVCGEAKQAWIEFPSNGAFSLPKQLVPVICKCEREKDEQEREADRKNQFAISLQYAREKFGIQPMTAYTPTFADDDNPKSPLSRTCRLYVQEWKQMRADNTGIIMFGSKGTGKSFYAACIVNELAKQQIPTAITTTAHLMGIMQGQWNKNDVIENLNQFSLLVLDDVGTERETTYGAEMMYAVIDARYRARLPLIVTTNMDIDAMKNETDLWRSRIYDRILEMCAIPIRTEGASRRSAIAEGRKDRARDILRRAMNDEH